ncbi:MAG: MMPL family transporter [Deltaproteobacteria bacterium]|nr:MMPL family transporter [Deltaproteobacteria bacterium]
MRAEASLRSPFARLGAWVGARPRRIVAGFAGILALAASYGASVADHLPTAGLEVIGSESAWVREESARRFGLGSADVVVLYRNPEGDVRDPLFGSRIVDALDAVLADPGVLGATSLYDTASPALASRDGRETLVTLSLGGDSTQKLATYRRIDPLLRAVEPPVEIRIGGLVPLSGALQDTARADAFQAERVALPIAGLLTLLFFRSVVAALLPILIGGFSVALSAAAMRFGTQFTEIAIFAMSVGSFLGLGLSLDYALLLVQRFREESARRTSPVEAVAATMDTAGRAVFVSGMAVAISMLALLQVPMVVLRSIAIGGVAVVTSALVGALLLLPALLAWLGPNVNRWALHPLGRWAGRPPEEIAPSPFWRRVGELSMRHPVTTALICVVVLLVLASPALRMRGAMPDSRALPPDSDVRVIDERLSDPQRFDPGAAAAIPVLVETPAPALAPASLRALRELTRRMEALPGVEGVRGAFDELDPALPAGELERRMAREPTASLLARTVEGSTALLIVDHPYSWRSAEATALVEALRALPRDGLVVGVGGPTAQTLDQMHALRLHGTAAVLTIAALNLAILLFAFRSIAVPIKAIVMNVLSLGASYGLLVWVFQEGHGLGWLGAVPLDGIDSTVPLVMFAVIFGLSMDYEVFLLSRIREEWLRSGDNRESVIQGLACTGRIITSAALILLVVVGAFATGDMIYVKQMGLGMAVAIALDVTLVRALLVPATMQLLGVWNWWLPRWLRAGGVAAAEERPAEP